MKFRSQHPPPPRAASRPLSGGGGRGSRSDGADTGLDSEWPTGFVDSGSSFGDGPGSAPGSSFGHQDASQELGLWGRPRRTAAGPVESWHDSSYVLRRGLEVRELSAREWNVCVGAVSATTAAATSGSMSGSPAPGAGPRRRGDAEDDA